jgi:hypothetical protein
MPNSDTDFNPLVIEEWKMWLRNTGIYGPGGAYFGTGRIPAFATIDDFNNEMGTRFQSWDADAFGPPIDVTPGTKFYEEWQRWRVLLIMHSTSDETSWIAEAGIDRTVIYGHQ